MRPLVVTGVIVIGIGLVVLVRGADFTTRQDVLKIGDVKVTADERRSIPPWVGGVVALLGAGLVATATLKRT